MNLFENLQIMNESENPIISEFKEFLASKNAQYIYNELDETKDGMQIVIYDGDWKHEHLYMKHLIDEFFTSKGMNISIASEEIGESDQDTYSARYNITFNTEPKEYTADVKPFKFTTEDVDTSNWKQRFKGMDIYISDKYPTYQIEKSYNGYGQEVWVVFKNDWTGSKHKRLFIASSFEKAVDYIENGKTPRKPKALDNIEEARSYGGAFDISDKAYFTRDDLDEFSNDVIEKLSDATHTDIIADVVECYLDEDTNELELTVSYGDYEHTHKEKIDMRKIRIPKDLIKVYSHKFVNDFLWCFNADTEHEEMIKESEDIIEESQGSGYIKHLKDDKGHYISVYKDNDGELYAEGDVPASGYTVKWDNEMAEHCEIDLGFEEIKDLNPANINLDEYEYCSHANGRDAHWQLYRKIVDGKGKWVACHQRTGEIREITYDQARGFEPIDDSSITRLSRDLGRMLLPKKESTDNSDWEYIEETTTKDDIFGDIIEGAHYIKRYSDNMIGYIYPPSETEKLYRAKLVSKNHVKSLGYNVFIELDSAKEFLDETAYKLTPVTYEEIKQQLEEIDTHEFLEIDIDNSSDLNNTKAIITGTLINGNEIIFYDSSYLRTQRDIDFIKEQYAKASKEIDHMRERGYLGVKDESTKIEETNHNDILDRDYATGEKIYNELKDYLNSLDQIDMDGEDCNWEPSEFNAKNLNADGEIYLVCGAYILIYPYINEWAEDYFRVIVLDAESCELSIQLKNGIENIFNKFKTNKWKLIFEG